MRIAGLLALALFFPALVHAADSPALTVYTISHDTIYPIATAESGFATTTTIDIAFSEQVKASIKIISSSGTTIKSLYSSASVTNPTPKVWDGTNTSGTRVDDGSYTVLISATSTATGAAMTDASKTITVESSDDSPSPDIVDEATDATTASASGGPAEYLPIPTLRIITAAGRTISAGADVAFTASVYDGKGNKRNDAVVVWSFGDGMRRTGASVFHSYYSPGEYLAVVRATTPDGGDERSEAVITVKDAGIKISSVSSRGMTLVNNDSRTLDLSFWRLSMGGKEFKIPEDTQILAGHTILFPSQVIGLPLSDSALLLYPSGEVATMYSASAEGAPLGGQPLSDTGSYKKVSEVEPILGARTNDQAYDDAVSAPRAETELAALGAALPPESPEPASRFSGIFKSPWTLGFLSVIAFAGGAFIFL